MKIHTPKQPWTAEQLQLLRQLYATTLTADLARQLGRPQSSVHQKAAALGLRKDPVFVADTARQRSLAPGHGSHAHQFKPGQRPWNEGLNYHPGGRCAETQFKPGQRQGRALQLVQPVGSLRVNGDCYLDRKVTDAGPMHRRWVAVHRLVWEAANGPIPAGQAVVFKPGRRSTQVQDITPDALELLTRAQLMARNTVHTLPKPLAGLAQLRGALTRQINRRQAQEDQA